MNKSENIEGLNVGKGMLTDVLLENISDFSLLNKMDRDHLDAPEIYRASKFWQKLNRLNVEWLKSEGLENFKRSVNNNYFNWMVSIRSIYFRKVARDFFGAAIRRPGKLLQVFTVSISEMYHKTYVSSNTKTTYLQRKVYALYLLFLHEFVRQRDEFGMFAMLEEPEIGNPIVINLNGKRISQDISNSYMEYSYVRRSLGNNFSGIKTVAEIGGGYGRLSHLFHLFHHQDSVRIVLIDLPPALFVAQWYLRKTFPDAQIMGYRDFKKFSEIEREFNNSSICFLLPHQLELLPGARDDDKFHGGDHQY